MIRQDSPAIQVGGYVLAGGASSRFGRDKALAHVAGKTLLQRTIRLLGNVADSVRVVTTGNRYAELPVIVLPDRWPGEGPLGGILSALHASKECGHAWNVIVSCDMPFLTREWLQYILDCSCTGHADVVFPRSRAGNEPLCACWRTAAMPALQAAFNGGLRSVTDATNAVASKVLDETHWKPFDTAGRIFWNMNTPRDYEDVVQILDAEKTSGKRRCR